MTLNANADAWIDQNSSTTNKGDDSILKVQAKSANNNMRALVRFNLPALPGGCEVKSANLRMFSPSSTTGRTLQVLRVAGTWTESAVTWANQPATTGTAVTTASGSGWREWNVAAQVQAMYTSTNSGFLVRDATENQGSHEQQFHSREKGVDSPQLVIAFKPAGSLGTVGGPSLACAQGCNSSGDTPVAQPEQINVAPGGVQVAAASAWLMIVMLVVILGGFGAFRRPDLWRRRWARHRVAVAL